VAVRGTSLGPRVREGDGAPATRSPLPATSGFGTSRPVSAGPTITTRPSWA